MWYLNATISRIFDLLLKPFQSAGPIWALFVLSLITGIILLLIFRYTSDQQGIKETKDKIKAHLLEIRLFKDNLKILLTAQKKIILYNLAYMKHSVKPMLFMVVPVLIIIVQVDGWFGYRPLKRGETAIISVSLSKNEPRFYSNISVETDEGITVENPPLIIPGRNEINWKIRANEIGKHPLKITILDKTYEKGLLVSQEGFARVSKLIVASSLWNKLLDPGVIPVDENSFVRKIEIRYPHRSIEVFGLKMHWLVVFFVLSIVGGFAFKGVIGVEV